MTAKLDPHMIAAANAECRKIADALGLELVEPSPDKPGLAYWIADAHQGALIEQAQQLLSDWFHREYLPPKKESRRVLTAHEMRL